MATPISDATRQRFIERTESSITPKGVAALYSRAEMLARLPLRLQRWIVSRAGGEDYMGFVVEPYCVFLAYEISDEAAAQRLLPPDYRLVPTSMFADGTPRLCAILGAFAVHTSVFWGSRVELYVIAENVRTGMLSWVICDYESNTINYDPGQGFSGATTSHCVVTTSHAGDAIVDVRSKERPNRLAVTASVPSGSSRALDQRLWVEGNLSVDYGGRLKDPTSQPFGLIFDPGEMTAALDIPLHHAHVTNNTFGATFRADEPFEVAVFPYAQHFLTTSYPRATPLRDRAGLEAAVHEQAG